MRKVRENIIASHGNYAVFPPGKSVFTDPHPVFGGPTIVPLDGQLVFYDNLSGISLDQVTVLDRWDVTLGVAVDTNKDGVVDAIRKAAFDKINKNYVQAFTAEGPRCAINEVVDVLFSCVHCGEPKSLTVTVEDNETQNQYPFNRPEAITVTSNQECCACDGGCPDTSDVGCKTVTDLVNQLNGRASSDPLKVPTFSRKVVPYEFTAARLYGGEGASQTWCFTPEASDDCMACNAVPFIKSFTYDITGEPVTLVFTGNANPADATQTLISQLSNIVRQINIALDGYGSAILTRGFGKCCPINLEINTCASDVTLLDGSDVVIEPCGSEDPLAGVELAGQCLNCGDTPTETTFDFGIRIIAKDVTVDTSCYPPNPPKGFLVRKINVYPSGGFTCGSTYVRKTQKAQLPENTGYQWQWRDYASGNGGSGREFENYNKNYGPLNLPGKNTRATSTFVNPDVEYCSYVIEHGLPHTNTGVSDPFRVARARTVVLIPAADDVTIADFEQIMNAYVGSGQNPVRATATCAVDQDQIETVFDTSEGYPDANGMIY